VGRCTKPQAKEWSGPGELLFAEGVVGRSAVLYVYAESLRHVSIEGGVRMLHLLRHAACLLVLASCVTVKQLKENHEPSWYAAC
jgi:hypothetical protein